MLKAKFLQQNNRTTINADVTHRSRLFRRRAAMRCTTSQPEPPSISPMTTALVTVAESRTGCPEVPSISGLAIAGMEPTVEAQVVEASAPARKAKKAARNRKTEVRDGAPRKRSSRGNGTDEAAQESGENLPPNISTPEPPTLTTEVVHADAVQLVINPGEPVPPMKAKNAARKRKNKVRDSTPRRRSRGRTEQAAESVADSSAVQACTEIRG